MAKYFTNYGIEETNRRINRILNPDKTLYYILNSAHLIAQFQHFILVFKIFPYLSINKKVYEAAFTYIRSTSKNNLIWSIKNKKIKRNEQANKLIDEKNVLKLAL